MQKTENVMDERRHARTRRVREIREKSDKKWAESKDRADFHLIEDKLEVYSLEEHREVDKITARWTLVQEKRNALYMIAQLEEESPVEAASLPV